ncbi:hypothetical protein RRG08_008995 [Elysia crispata]|uniref:Uncharacterized protein n=1 Tax=Elysia crispata TaxID=231223 RepID=A0AAE1D4S6_9GAST|nr:hypothetical protein RRG08_008995 [Elysia crispata]
MGYSQVVNGLSEQIGTSFQKVSTSGQGDLHKKLAFQHGFSKITECYFENKLQCVKSLRLCRLDVVLQYVDHV